VSDRQPWTTTEVALLRDQGHLGAAAVALLLGRSVGQVKDAAYRYRISLRVKGERRGTLLGQPRGSQWRESGELIPAVMAEIRAGVLAGEIDMADLEARARDLVNDDRPLCPACGERAQAHRSTGLCSVCHPLYLARAHREGMATKQAKRELWQAKQESSRSRRRKP